MMDWGVGNAPNETGTVARAKLLGVEEVPITGGPFAGLTLCGTCGRMICHPDCPRGGFSKRARAARGEMIEYRCPRGHETIAAEGVPDQTDTDCRQCAERPWIVRLFRGVGRLS